MAQGGFWSRHGVTVIALAAALAIVAVVVWLWNGTTTTVQAMSDNTNRSSPGWEIRYNATLALARRSSQETPLSELQEMLDEEKQLRNFESRTQSGLVSVDEQGARTTVLKALEGVASLHQKQPDLDLSRLDPAVEKLTHSSNLTLREKAGEVRQELAKK